MADHSDPDKPMFPLPDMDFDLKEGSREARAAGSARPGEAGQETRGEGSFRARYRELREGTDSRPPRTPLRCRLFGHRWEPRGYGMRCRRCDAKFDPNPVY